MRNRFLSSSSKPRQGFWVEEDIFLNEYYITIPDITCMEKHKFMERLSLFHPAQSLTYGGGEHQLSHYVILACTMHSSINNDYF